MRHEDLTVADLHEMLCDHMRAEGRLLLRSWELGMGDGTIESILNFNEYAEDEFAMSADASLVRTTIEDALLGSTEVMSGSHPKRERPKVSKRAGTNRKRSGMKLRGSKGHLPAFKAA